MIVKRTNNRPALNMANNPFARLMDRPPDGRPVTLSPDDLVGIQVGAFEDYRTAKTSNVPLWNAGLVYDFVPERHLPDFVRRFQPKHYRGLWLFFDDCNGGNFYDVIDNFTDEARAGLLAAGQDLNEVTLIWKQGRRRSVRNWPYTFHHVEVRGRPIRREYSEAEHVDAAGGRQARGGSHGSPVRSGV